MPWGVSTMASFRSKACPVPNRRASRILATPSNEPTQRGGRSDRTSSRRTRARAEAIEVKCEKFARLEVGVDHHRNEAREVDLRSPPQSGPSGSGRLVGDRPQRAGRISDRVGHGPSSPVQRVRTQARRSLGRCAPHPCRSRSRPAGRPATSSTSPRRSRQRNPSRGGLQGCRDRGCRADH